MFKSIMEQQGKHLVFWMRDVMCENEIAALPFENKMHRLLERAYRQGDFEGFTDDECKYILRDFVEPVAWRDVKLEEIDRLYVSVIDACQLLWQGIPLALRNAIRNEK